MFSDESHSARQIRPFVVRAHYIYVRGSRKDTKMQPNSDSLTKSSLEGVGFTGFSTIRELQATTIRKPELSKRGLYVVVCQEDYKPDFIDLEKVRRNRNVIKPWSQNKLLKKWVPETEILYLDRAGDDKKQCSLRRRITDLVRHSQGKTTDQGPHIGGELLWQLRGYENFELGYFPTDKPEEFERSLLAWFYSKTGRVPYANRMPRTLLKEIQSASGAL